MSIPNGLAARAILKTVCSKQLLYIEVREDRKFADFYYTCTVIKKGRRNVITSSAPRHRGFAASLEEAAEKIAQTMKKNAKQIQKVNLEVHITVRIYRKRLYRKLLALRPDELGLAHVSVPAQRTTVSPVAYIQQLQTATRQEVRNPNSHNSLSKSVQFYQPPFPAVFSFHAGGELCKIFSISPAISKR